MAVKSSFVLHYGGEKFEVDNDKMLDELSGDLAVGTIKFRLKDGRSLTIATGSGIPIAIEEVAEPKAKAIPVRIR